MVMLPPPVVLGRVRAAHQGILARYIEQGRKMSGAPKRVEVEGVKSYVLSPQPLSKLYIKGELKNRMRILKQLHALEEEREAGGSVIYCHITKAFLLADTTLIHVTDMKLVQTALYAVWKVKIRGIKEMFLQIGADEVEAENASWYNMPSYLGSLAQDYLQPNLGKTWNCMRATDIKAEDSTAEDMQTQKRVYTKVAFMYDDGTVRLPAELFVFESAERILCKSSSAKEEKCPVVDAESADLPAPPPPAKRKRNSTPLVPAKRARRTYGPKEGEAVITPLTDTVLEGKVCV